MMAAETPMMTMMMSDNPTAGSAPVETPLGIIGKIEKRTREHVATPACSSIASLVFIEVTIASDAGPGERELRLATLRGVSNPIAFHVGQLPESTRKPMITATIQTLGKEEQALRRRPADEVEDQIKVPCTLNGQIASGEVNRYRFEARKGQRLVISTLARQLIPYVADAVPGWFQPVLALYDTQGKEVAYADDYRFKPDPVILFEVPKDGEYVLAITDAIYRGREDFVYRITIGELPFVESLFPLGRQAGTVMTPVMKGWNLQGATLTPPAKDARPGIRSLAASRKGFVSNRVPFAVDTLPDGSDQEPNNTLAAAQKVSLPIIVSGRIDKPDDWDVFQFVGKSNATIVVEVQARRLDSPLDSVIKLTDAAGRVLAFNDDREDLGAGVNTHHADSWFMARLPAEGAYYVHLGDTARKGGEEYGYRLRISAPQLMRIFYTTMSEQADLKEVDVPIYRGIDRDLEYETARVDDYARMCAAVWMRLYVENQSDGPPPPVPASRAAAKRSRITRPFNWTNDAYASHVCTILSFIIDHRLECARAPPPALTKSRAGGAACATR